MLSSPYAFIHYDDDLLVKTWDSSSSPLPEEPTPNQVSCNACKVITMITTKIENIRILSYLGVGDAVVGILLHGVHLLHSGLLQRGHPLGGGFLPLNRLLLHQVPGVRSLHRVIRGIALGGTKKTPPLSQSTRSPSRWRTPSPPLPSPSPSPRC